MSGIKVFTKKDLSLRPDVPGAMMWAVGLEKAMLTFFELDPETVFPVHSHESEQITLVIDGELSFTYEGKTVTLGPGDCIAIPSNAPHSAFTGKRPCRAVDAWSPVRKEFLLSVRQARMDEMPFIEESIKKFGLDGEDMDFSQFKVVVEGGEVIAFGRIRRHGGVFELGSVGVREDRRGRGIGTMMVKYLIDAFPSDEVYIVTDMPGYFRRFDFKEVSPGPEELEEKIRRVCKARSRAEAVVMIYRKTDADYAVF